MMHKLTCFLFAVLSATLCVSVPVKEENTIMKISVLGSGTLRPSKVLLNFFHDYVAYREHE